MTIEQSRLSQQDFQHSLTHSYINVAPCCFNMYYRVFGRSEETLNHSEVIYDKSAGEKLGRS